MTAHGLDSPSTRGKFGLAPNGNTNFVLPGFRGSSVKPWRRVCLYFTNVVLEEQGLERMKAVNDKDQLELRRQIWLVWPALSMVGKAYFQNHLDLINHLTTNLSIGPVRTEELTRDALCKTPLLRTARFASQPVEEHGGESRITGPRSVRLWMRTNVPGIHELQILGGLAWYQKHQR